ncbi:lysophospholipid acyltransferase family protein [Acidobacteriota bacterium]
MRTIFLFILYVILVIFLIPVVFFCSIFRTARPLYILGRSAIRLGQWILGLKIQIVGLDGLDKKKTYVFMPNHISFLDGPLMFLIIPRYMRVIFKKEILRIPIIGWAMKIAEFIPVDRKGIQGGRKSVERATQLILKKGYDFLIFPEGTRSLDGTMKPLKRGGFFLAINSQTDIVPVSIQGTFEIMPKGQFSVRKGVIKVVFHPAISVKGCTVENLPNLSEKVRFAIASGLGEGRKRNENDPV